MNDPDPRFARLRTDPRFRRPKKNKQKVVVDDRFKTIFEDDGSKKKSSKSGRVDKYGRSISDTHEKEDLRRFYRLESQEDEDVKDVEDKNEQIIDYARGQVLLESSDEENDDDQTANQESDIDDGEVILGRHASKPIPVLAEGGDEYLEVDLNEDEDAYADLDAQAEAYTEQHAINDEGAVNSEEPEHTGIKTNRIAVVNLDWDHVRASHLFKIFSSLISPTAPSAAVAVSATTASTSTSAINRDGDEKTSSAAKIIRGKVLSVRVYPSDFGKERLKREEEEGPPKEIYKKSRCDDVLGSLIQEDDGDPYDEKALRKYQLERLRYYYAIVTCDTVEAAVHIFSELDGTELERSANIFDLSFVPDDMTFDDDFRDEATPATEATGTTCKPLDFSTDALRHSKVTLKWDEDDPERDKLLRRALSKKEIEEDDFRAYIASSSSEDEEEENETKNNSKSKAERERLRKLLLGGGGANDQEDANPFVDEDKGAEGDVEITFMPGLSETNVNAGEETTIEAYRRKQKEKRLAREKEKKEKENQGDDKEKDAKGKKNRPIDDDFFAAGSGSESSEGAKEGLDSRKKSKKSNFKKDREKESQVPDVEIRPATEAELSLLVAPDDVSSEHKHFDMKAVLKAEKSKRKKRDRKKKNKGAGGEDEDEIQGDFQIDVKDERFRALHEDHTFAIDPSNPHFKKTKNMAALLEERAHRQSGKESVSETKTNSSKNDNSAPSQSLQSLVESVKRKSSDRLHILPILKSINYFHPPAVCATFFTFTSPAHSSSSLKKAMAGTAGEAVHPSSQLLKESEKNKVGDFYEPKSTVRYASFAGLQGGIAGTLVATIQTALGKHNKGATGVFTRYGGTIGFFAAMGFTFAATEAVVANTREKDDPLNGVAGGCAAGFLAGLRARSIPVAFASCAFLGTAVGVYDRTGRIAGEKRDRESPETWEERRKRFFKQKPPAEIPVHPSSDA
ncbi:hypothetical protein A7U60_g4505 [Sanghuangporus baumii]|uniref:NUC153 domain-containing protein n=1 Tax=Sanghuangporus baumii TaxID=108892 RepID=A0A9Q5HYD8_SANBA|nr:hypothetical protein A7U60_g4505 [Sanghuangporus baumii]